MISRIFSVLLVLGSVVAVGCAGSETEAVDESAGAATTLGGYTKRDGTLTESSLYARNRDAALGGEIDFLRPVLKGVLYRGGFSAGDADHSGLGPLTKNFCDQGFSAARYIDFSKSNTRFGATSCGAGSFDYEAGTTARPDEIMKQLHDIIKSNAGPMYVHCMWGVHSSGAIAAMALVQFCGWPETKAKEYWDKARNNASCAGGCPGWIDDKFKKFHFNADLAITDEEQAAICPH